MSKHYRAVLQRAKFIVLWAVVFVLVVFLGTFVAFLRTPLVAKTQASTSIVFPMGASLIDLTQTLKQQHLLFYPRSYIVVLAYLQQASKHLHAGEYLLTPGIFPGDLLTKMVNEDVVWRNLLFVEGITWAQMQAQLASNSYLLKSSLEQTTLAQKLHIANNQLEGWFFPDTYRYTAGLTAFAILHQAHALMLTHLTKAWASRSAHLPYRNAYDLLIVASLVEKEAKIPSDYPRIAGVIVKRLQLGMPLQIDASVIYGLGAAYDGKLKSSQLKMASPYNTYLCKGLPPTPIAMPGEASLQAAAQPVMSDALYYVASGTGGHVFSATFRQQVQAIARLRLFQRARNDF